MDATSSHSSTSDGGADFQIAYCKEPTIGELLADPLTRILMKADHVDIAAFEHMLDSVADRFRARRSNRDATCCSLEGERRRQI